MNFPGYTTLLLENVANSSNKQDLRLAAAIQFKSVIGARYNVGINGKTSDKYAPIDDAEKAYIRETILGALVTDHLAIRNMLEDSLYRIVEVDYPTNWSSLPDLILGALQGAIETPEQILAALIALRTVIRRFDRSDAAQGDRASIRSVADSTFPILKSLLEYLLANDSAQSQEVIILLLKVVWDGSIYGLPDTWVNDKESFDGWMQLFVQIFQQPVPTEGIEHASQLKKLPWFSAKRSVLRFWIRFCSRFMRKSGKNANDTQEFADFFSATYPPLFLDNTLQAMAMVGQGKMVWPSKLMGTMLDFLNTSLAISSLWQTLKPHVWDIIRNIFIPLLSFTEEDSYMFEYESDMYVAQQLDPLDNEDDPRAVSLNFIFDLCKHREPVWLQELLIYISTDLFRTYNEGAPAWTTPSDGSATLSDFATHDPQKFSAATVKYAGMHIIGSIRALFIEEPEYHGAIEDIISTHILPDLHQGPAWLRAKACWVFARYCKVPFTDESILLAGLDGLLNAMLRGTDDEFPLVAEAAAALFDLIPNPTVRPIIGPLVGELVHKYLSLMTRVDSDAIVHSLQYLMRHFPKMMRKSAVLLMSNLTQAFLKADHNSNEIVLGDDTATDNAFMAASSTVRAIHTLYKAVRSSPSILPTLEPFIIPVLDVCLSQTGASYLEDILSLCTEVSYNTAPPFSPDLWQHLFMALAKVYMNWGPDYMQQMICTFDNFLSRDPETFLAPGAPYLDTLCSFATKYFVDPKYPELDLLPLTRLFEALLLEHMGAVDHILEPLIRLTVGRIAMGGSVPIRTALIELILNCFYYNAELTTNILESNGWTEDVLKLTFNLIVEDAFERVCDKKTASLGISALLRLPMAQQSPYVQEKFLQIVATWMQVTQGAEMQRIALEDAMREEDDEDDIGSVEFSDEDQALDGDDGDDKDDFEYTDDDEVMDDEDDDYDDDAFTMENAYAMMKQQALEEGEDMTEDDYAELLQASKENDDDEGGHVNNRGDHEDLDDGFGPVGNSAERLLESSLYRWTLAGQEFSEELPTESIHEMVFLAETFEGMESAVKQQLLDSFSPEMLEMYQQLLDVASDKAEKMAFEAHRKAQKEAERQELRAYYASLKDAQSGQ